MKILLVTDTYRPRINGVVTSIDTFANEYRKLGHECVVVAPEFPERRHVDHRAEDDIAEKHVII